MKKLEPLGALSPDSLREISRMCYVERVSRNLDPLSTERPARTSSLSRQGRVEA
ncbi:MAG: hypothetical protein M5R42_08125 [Rhodocyclaceae bacterium]|nr:hypothetical protein [Rhodocyclaceae bacterium]